MTASGDRGSRKPIAGRVILLRACHPTAAAVIANSYYHSRHNSYIALRIVVARICIISS